MSRPSLAGLMLIMFTAAISVASSPAPVGAQASPAMGSQDLLALAKVQTAIGAIRDSIQIQLALTRNKTVQAQAQLRESLATQIDDILHHSGMTEEEYQRKTFVISTTPDLRKTFDSVLVALTGVPTPGQVQANAGGRGGGRGGAPVPVPPGPVGTHIGHVINAFSDTPNGAGLLPTAMAEARIAVQHAVLGARDPNDLNAMKLHAGHVINAIDPTIVATGPGQGYGVKKATTGVATHIDLAAKAPSASMNVITHANHIATSARNTLQRADKAVALAQQIQAATTAADAAGLMSQLVSLTNQLIAGVDANGDGVVTWEDGEGGLQQADEHLTLLLTGEGGAR
jgi:hypothetical protein